MSWLAKMIIATAMLAWAMPHVAPAQDMLRYLDLKSDDFTKAEMTRAEIEAALASDPDKLVDLSGKRLNGIDLSGLDLRRVKFQSARLNRANLAGANLDGVMLDQAWALGADLTGVSLRGASLFATQLIGAKLYGADLSDARITGDLSTGQHEAGAARRRRSLRRHAQPVHGADARHLAVGQSQWREPRECEFVACRARICLATQCKSERRQAE